MKKFTIKDTKPFAGHLGIFCDKEDLVSSPLEWQKMGLQETATGYGGKLTTTYKIHYDGKLYRLYCTCYSNNGSVWFIARGQMIFVN